MTDINISYLRKVKAAQTRRMSLNSARQAESVGLVDTAKQLLEHAAAIKSPTRKIGIPVTTFSQSYMGDPSVDKLPRVDDIPSDTQHQREMWRDRMRLQHRRRLEGDRQVYRLAGKLTDTGLEWMGRGLL